MTTSRWIPRVAVTLMMVLGGGAALVAEQAQVPSAADAKAAPALQTLKVTLTISRFQGEKKVANTPFTFFIESGRNISLRMGSMIPVPTSRAENGNATTVNYQSVGTNIDAEARSLADGRYSLMFTVSDSQLASASENANRPTTLMGMPIIQSFTSSNMVYLRDRQTLQYTTATDKTTGEVVKIDVTLEVVK